MHHIARLFVLQERLELRLSLGLGEGVEMAAGLVPLRCHVSQKAICRADRRARNNLFRRLASPLTSQRSASLLPRTCTLPWARLYFSTAAAMHAWIFATMAFAAGFAT